MSQNVEFILSLEDKQFTASIDRAGKLLTRFGEQVTKPAQKIQTFERSLGSVARIIGVLESKLDSTADKLQDVAAGFELASDATRKMRGNITSLNSGLKALIERVDTTTSSVEKLTASLRKVQSELNDFSDWATYASKSASRFGTEVKEASASVSGMNTRLNTTTKRLSNWGVTTSQAAEGLKKVREQMDEVIGRQQLISKPVRVRTSGSGDGGGGRRSGASGHSGKSNEEGMFSGLRGNIFLLGEIGDAARTVTDIMFGWQKPIVEAAAEMERMRVMLRGLNKEKSNPGQAAADDMKYIVDMAQNAPFAMQALTDSFVKFRSAGLDPTDGSLKALVDSVARFGGDSELLKRAAVAVQQMSGKGVVSMEELRQQLGEAVPNAMQAMADAAGITMGELTKAVASGTVEAKQALSLMFVGLRAENENAAKDMMQTYTGALAQLQTSFTLFADRVGQAGYLDSLSKGMKELASIMNSAEGISFANSLGSGLTTAIDGLRQLAQWLAKNQELVINLGKVVAAMVAFKLMRAGIMGVVGAGSQMVSTFATMATAIQTPFNLGATAVTRFNRAARMGLAPIPSLIFAIRGAITGLKGAFAGLTAFIAANPIGAAFTVATVAVAGLITYMTMLRSETSKVVDEIRKIPEAMTAAKRAQMTQAEFERDNAAKTGKGVMSNQGTVLGLGTTDKAAQKALAQYMRNQMDSATYQRTLPDGTPMMDFEGKPIIGPKQLKTQLNLQKASSASSLEKMSDEERAAAIAALTKAREQDAAAAEKAAQRSANASQRAAKKEQAAQQKLAAGYQKALDKADQLMGQMGESSKATVSFDQSLRDTTKSLTDLANAVPNEFITQEMIDKAKKRLEDLKNATPEYREMFNRRNVEQMISTWAPKADSIISAGYTPSREEKVADFEDTYNRNLKALIELRDKASDPKVVALYTKKINQLIAAGNTALIKETGTATQKLALEYENLAEQIESTWTDLFSGLTDVLTDFVINGKMSFSSLSQSILKDITNMVVKSQITLPLMNMLGMGTTAAGSSQSGNLLTGVASAVANQGVRISNTVNGDKSVGEATKETSSSVTGLGQTTQQTTSAIGTATNAIGSWVSGLFDSTEAKDAETKAVKDSIFSMQNLSSVTGALSAAFAMLGANASGSGNKWLNFGATVASGLVSVWAGGGFDGLMSGSSGSTSGFNNLTSSAADGTNGIPAIPKFANGGIFGKDGVIPLRAYQKGGIANSPQLALFGEGDMNEAYVPLPDGRTIPVTLSTDGMSGGGNVLSPVSIEINVHSDGSTTESGDTESIWNNAAQRMKAIALETIAQEKRPGGSLNPNTQRN